MRGFTACVYVCHRLNNSIEAIRRHLEPWESHYRIPVCVLCRHHLSNHRLGNVSNSAKPTTAFGGASCHFVCCVDSMGSWPFMFTACGDFCHGLSKSIEAARWRLYACETNYKIWRRSRHFVSCTDSADIVWAALSVRGRFKFCETNYSIWRRILHILCAV